MHQHNRRRIGVTRFEERGLVLTYRDLSFPDV